MSNIFTKSTFIIIYFSILLSFTVIFSQNIKNEKSWSANWIWQEADGPENTWMCFRKTFNLTRVPLSVFANIAVDSKYWMFINDELVVFEGGLNRGPTPSAGYYDRIDIQSYLFEGMNTIAILVWYWGNEGRNNVDSGKGGLLFEADMGSFILISDSTWKSEIHPAYFSVPFELNAEGSLYLYGGWNSGFDARKDIPGWYMKDYDDTSWNTSTEKGIPPCVPWNELWKRPIPQWKNYGLKEYTNYQTFPEISDGSSIVAKLPYNAQITTYLKIHASSGHTIKIQTDHYETNGYYGQRTEYITKDGIQEFESLAWQNGEKVIYEIPAGIQIIELKYRETGYDTEFSGSFVCDDEFYNLLCKKAVRTQYVCMRDNYMDCPDRERGQWIGDVSVQVPQTFYAMDRNTDQLTQKVINEFIYWREGNRLRGLVPGAHTGELASQSLNAISTVGIIMAYYMNTGDLTPIYLSYDAIKNYLYEWNLDEKGLVYPRSNWNGQGPYVDNILIENTWYYMALKSAKTMALLTGNIGDVEGLQTRLDSIANNFNQNFWKGDAYRSSYFIDDRANGLVVLSGLAEGDKLEKIASILTQVKNAWVYMEGYVLEAMFKIGNIKDALTRMKEKYGSMVLDTTCTTLWESFSPIGSLNHAWAGAPLTLLYKYVAGIEPVTPGYNTYQILPQLGCLNHVDVTVPSIKGDIIISIIKDGTQFRLNLNSPHSTTAIVGIPKNIFSPSTINTITVNSTVIWENRSYQGDIPGLSWYSENNSHYEFKVIPGTYSFTAFPVTLTADTPPDKKGYIMAKNAPNPFNAYTTISIQIPKPDRTVIKVYDLQGREINTLLDSRLKSTTYQITWKGNNTQGLSVASGVYFFQIVSGNKKITRKMLLIR